MRKLRRSELQLVNGRAEVRSQQSGPGRALCLSTGHRIELAMGRRDAPPGGGGSGDSGKEAREARSIRGGLGGVKGLWHGACGHLIHLLRRCHRVTFPSRRWRRRIPYCYPLKQLWDCSVQGPCSLGEAVWPGPARSQGCGHYVPPVARSASECTPPAHS